MTGPIELGPLDVLLAASLVVVNGLLSVWLGLGLERRLAVAVLRAAVQLTLIGLVLQPVFDAKQPLLVAAICAGMIGLAARAAARSTTRRYRGMGLASLLALVVGAGITATVGTTLIVRVDPWWEPRYLVPMLGMILGNGLNGISLGLDRCLQQLDEGRAGIDALLAAGAKPFEAARPVAAEALRAGMLPILNSMTVVGLVTIPGMMTGQILGGTPPLQAAAYQLMILFLIAAATGLGALLSVLLAVRALFDEAGRLRPERILKGFAAK